MLNPPSCRPLPLVQRGVVLILALIVLAAMSLAAIGLMRTVLTSNRVVGNLAFQQAAVQSADVGVETAIAWLEQKSQELKSANPPELANKLFNNLTSAGGETYNYVAVREDPGVDQTWDSYWTGTLVAANNRVNTLPMDAAGNTVSFVIHRLCANQGDATNSGCESAPTLALATQNSSKSNSIKLKVPSQVYYRITVRVLGPRNATSFIQSIVAI